MPPRSPAGNGREIPAAPAEAAADPIRTEIAALPFETAMKELEAIVEQLEKGQVALEASIALYERGEALKAHCDALLSNAETRIEKITLSREGRPTGTAPLDELP